MTETEQFGNSANYKFADQYGGDSDEKLVCGSNLVLARGQSKPSTNTYEDEILKLEQQWIDAAARPDLPALRKIIADNFIGTAFGPAVLTKDDIVPSDGSTGNHMPKCLLVDPVVQVFGDTAVLMGNLQPEDPKAGAFRVTTVFQRQQQGWQIIAIHMSPAGPK